MLIHTQKDSARDGEWKERKYEKSTPDTEFYFMKTFKRILKSICTGLYCVSSIWCVIPYTLTPFILCPAKPEEGKPKLSHRMPTLWYLHSMYCYIQAIPFCCLLSLGRFQTQVLTEHHLVTPVSINPPVILLPIPICSSTPSTSEAFFLLH